jgi:hypothetical protein
LVNRTNCLQLVVPTRDTTGGSLGYTPERFHG